jgi:hypothetical protein
VMTTTLLPISSIHWLYVAELGCVNDGHLRTGKFAASHLTDVRNGKDEELGAANPCPGGRILER